MSTAHPTQTSVPFDLDSPSDSSAPRDTGSRGTDRAASAPAAARGTGAPAKPSGTGTTPAGPRLPAWARVILAMVGMMAAAMSGTLASIIPGADAAYLSSNPWIQNLGLAIAAGIVLASYLLITWGLVRGVDRRPFRAVGLSLTAHAGLGLAIALAITVSVVVGVSAAVQALGWGRIQETGGVGDAPVLAIIVNVLLLAFVLQGIGEETIFRGYLLQSLSRRPVVAVVVSALAFGILHLVSSGGQEGLAERFLYLAIPTGFALLAGFLAIAFRSVWAAIGVHAGFHVASAVAVVLGVTVTGPAQWLASGGALAVVGVAVALLIPRARWAQVAAEGPYGR